MRALVVDDDRDNMEVLALALATVAGWEVLAVDTSMEALEICRSVVLDVVLLDVEMPQLDGPGVLVALRADPRTATLPVIFVTACAGPALTTRLRSLGALAVLAKPFDPLRIGSQLAGILAG
jgi:CheY-like chemotaxis protein